MALTRSIFSYKIKNNEKKERIGQDIADIMAEITGSEDVAVVLEGYHSCVSARGIKKNNTRTMTVELRGSFKDDAALQMYLR